MASAEVPQPKICERAETVDTTIPATGPVGMFFSNDLLARYPKLAERLTEVPHRTLVGRGILLMDDILSREPDLLETVREADPELWSVNRINKECAPQQADTKCVIL